MKLKNYAFLLVLLFGFQLAQSQNLVVNGDLESWTAGEPDGWNLFDNITQETTTVHGGSSSANHTSGENSNYKLQQSVEGIVGGQEYTISFWYYDNDPMAKTRIWSAWTAAGASLPNNEDILKPTVYSEDNASWMEFNHTLVAPVSADGFKLEVRVYKQDGNMGGMVIYDDFVISGDIIINPEPTNYPTAFVANTNGTGIDLTWTDATGDQLPLAYIIMAGTEATLPVPVDGTPVENDTDLSDGSGALNVAYGEQLASFPGLEANTTYYFTIYPYTNAAANIDFKTDGTAPAANVTTSNTEVIEFQNFDESWGNWTSVSVIGDEVWSRDNTYGIGDTPCASMSGYNGGALDNEDWLISPMLDLDGYNTISLNFFTAMNYTGPDLECMVSTDYSGSGDPNTATWTNFTFTWSTGYFEWTESGNIDLSAYSGSSAYVAFKFASTTAGSATWELDDITISAEGSSTVDPEPTNYPTAFGATAGTSSIVLDWTDAAGAQLPGSYIVYAGTDATLPVPMDGTPVANDPDLSDGSGALNVAFGAEMVTFDGLGEQTMYYFTIYPYTNSGVNIDYKNDGTAPAANATTTFTPEPTNYPTMFIAVEAGTIINLSWTDATGDQLPENYILFAGNASGLPLPADGTPVADDMDLSDGSGAVNIAFGTQQAAFGNLDTSTTYYFSIYPYTNGGANIDYKNDGTAPAAEATTTSAVIVTIEEENFDVDWGNWMTFSVVGDEVWNRDNTYGVGDTPCAAMSGYNGAPFDNEDWLISPALNLDGYDNETLEFYTAMAYIGPDLECMVSTDYIGTGDPSAATWANEAFTWSIEYFEWTSSGIIDLSAYSGSAVYVAFKFASTTDGSATWEVDDISIKGEEILSVDNSILSRSNISIYPNPADDIISINMENMDYSNVVVRSITGKQVKSFELNNTTGSYDLSDLQAGIYFVVFSNENSTAKETYKLIVR